jgi:hypothetical protein
MVRLMGSREERILRIRRPQIGMMVDSLADDGLEAR